MSSSNKHILSSPSTLVQDALQGLARLNPQLTFDPESRVLYRQVDNSKVSLIAGGGSGHEPAHASYVGGGMLTAAVPGNVFASPNTAQILRGIELASSEAGTLIIVKNYTGDVLHFGLAKEKHAAQNPSAAAKTRFINVTDDVSVGREQGGIVGRRGLAGTVLVHKIAGALAAEGGSIDAVENIAKYVNSRLATLGAGLDHVHVPGTEVSEAYLKSDELEVGMGIHNEPGFQKLRPIPPAPELISNLVETLTSTSDKDRSFLPFEHNGKDEVVLLVNNLGGLSELELSSVAEHAVTTFEKKNIKVKRLLVGTFMTSLNMPGFSLTVLLLPAQKDVAGNNVPAPSSLLALLDAPANAPGWKWHAPAAPRSREAFTKAAEQAKEKKEQGAKGPAAADPKKFVDALCAAAKSVIDAEQEITRLDTVAGDGDCGLTLKAGAEGVLKRIENGAIDGSDIVKAVLEISEVAENDMGGTSGALYSIYFSALGSAIRSSQPTEALSTALKTLYTYTRARPPSRTLVDPLDAFVTSVAGGASPKDALEKAREATEKGKELVAKAGRAAYVGQDDLQKQAVPDPGAVGVVKLLEGFLSVY